MFGGGGGEAPVQLAVSSCSEEVATAKRKSKGTWWYTDKKHSSGLCRLFYIDVVRGVFLTLTAVLSTAAVGNFAVSASPWSGFLFFIM